MSSSKPVPSFTLDVLCYLNRDQLERFSIACRHIKYFVERYFRSKPYRIFDRLQIFGESYALVHNRVQWHPNRDDYSVQQFLARQKCSIDKSKHYFDLFVDPLYYSFAEMRPYLGPTVRMDWTGINIFGDGTYNSEHIKQMESIAYLSRNAINIYRAYTFNRRNGDADFQLILDSPTILQCRVLVMDNVHFSPKSYKILYTVGFIYIDFSNGEIELNYWLEFLEQPEAKPVFVFRGLRPETIENVLGRLSRAFSSAVSRNAFKIVFTPFRRDRFLTEFRATNKTSNEILELKKAIPADFPNEWLNEYVNYKLERSSVVVESNLAMLRNTFC